MESSGENRKEASRPHPALQALLGGSPLPWVVAEVQVRRRADGFELRHVADQETSESGLQRKGIEELRPLAQVTALGSFRPLKSAPTLQRGWYAWTANEAELERALDHLYPGALADWHAAQKDPAPITHYREFTGRQTGMYRATQQLDDVQASRVARAVCHREFCLKRRLWTVGDLPPDAAGEKSLVPCLEPCALLLEFARKARRWEQEEGPGEDKASDGGQGRGAEPEDKGTRALKPGSLLASVRQSVAWALERPPTVGSREGDFDDPGNRRRLRWVLEKLGEAG